MTPVPQQLVRSPGWVRAVLAASLGMLLLAALFLPAREPGTHGLVIEWRPSGELAGLLFLVAMGALVRPQFFALRGPALALALLVVSAALLNLADAVTSTLLGRDLNLYWDLRHMPSLIGLARESAGLWRVSGAAVLLTGAILMMVALSYWIWRKVLAALTDRRIAIGAVVFLGVALDVTAFAPAETTMCRRESQVLPWTEFPRAAARRGLYRGARQDFGRAYEPSPSL